MFPYLLVSFLTLVFAQGIRSQYDFPTLKFNNSEVVIKNNRIFYVFIFLTWVLVYAFKGTTGTDAWGYWGHYKKIFVEEISFWHNVRVERDFFYQATEWIFCRSFSGKWIWACAGFAVILYVPILWLFAKKSINPCFSCIMYVFYMDYFFGFNGLRQGLSMGFSLIAFYFFLTEKKYFQYLLFMFIAFGFHSAAMLAIPLHYILLQNIRSKRSFFIILSFLLVYLFLAQIWGGVMGTLDIVGQDKMVNDYGNLRRYSAMGRGSILRLLVWGALIWVAGSRYRVLRQYFPEYDRDLWVMVIGFLMTLIMYKFVLAARLSAYVTSGMPLIFPKLAYAYGVKNRKIMTFALGIVFFFYMISLLLHGDSDLYPYVPVWVSERY